MITDILELEERKGKIALGEHYDKHMPRALLYAAIGYMAIQMEQLRASSGFDKEVIPKTLTKTYTKQNVC